MSSLPSGTVPFLFGLYVFTATHAVAMPQDMP